MRMEETSRRKRRMGASSVGGQGSEGLVAPQMNGLWISVLTSFIWNSYEDVVIKIYEAVFMH
jgi:hypothetical protein